MGQLNDLQVKAAQPLDKEYLLADGEGLYLRVRPTAKVWVYRYKQLGKEAKLSLGHYPIVSLVTARKKARAEAEKRAGGVDPREARRAEDERDRVARLNTFELLARAWHGQAKKDRQWSAGYAEKVIRHLELHIFPWIGHLPVEAIMPTELVRCLHRIKERGNLETAQRVREAVQHVYQYSVDTGTLEPARNFVNTRTGGLPPPRSRHYAAITDPKQLGQLLRDIQAYKGNVLTRAALQLSPMLFQRPGQLRLAHWEDISFEHKICKRSANPSSGSRLKLRTSCLGNQPRGRDEDESRTNAELPGCDGGVPSLWPGGQGVGPGQWRTRAFVVKLVRAFPTLAGEAGRRGRRTEVQTHRLRGRARGPWCYVDHGTHADELWRHAARSALAVGPYHRIGRADA
jgi:hypothetical protein